MHISRGWSNHPAAARFREALGDAQPLLEPEEFSKLALRSFSWNAISSNNKINQISMDARVDREAAEALFANASIKVCDALMTAQSAEASVLCNQTGDRDALALIQRERQL